jgi:5-methylcytosine-specific restriction endonuclease McrA
MGRNKTGINVTCPSCGKAFYRSGHNIKNNTKKYCSVVCAGIARRGEGNPFYGKHHSLETIARISAINKANPPKGTGPKKGIFKHSEEAKKKMSESLRARWQHNRTDMLAYTKLGKNTPYKGINGLPRWKLCFTRTQKRDWVGNQCAYCKTTLDLVIDHIIPIICGGINEKNNAQTLCRPCNRWKMRYVDRPLYFALLGSERG